MYALALRHLEVAELGLEPALVAREQPLDEWLAAVQSAVLESQRFPSQALELLSSATHGPLTERAAQLRERVIAHLQQRLELASHSPTTAHLRAEAALGTIGELSVLAWLREGQQPSPLCAELLRMAVRNCEAPA